MYGISDDYAYVEAMGYMLYYGYEHVKNDRWGFSITKDDEVIFETFFEDMDDSEIKEPKEMLLMGIDKAIEEGIEIK